MDSDPEYTHVVDLSDSDSDEVVEVLPPEVNSDSEDEALHTAQLLLSGDGRRLFRIRRTVMEMLRDRGYLVPNAELTGSPEQFGATFGNSPSREDMKFITAKMSNPEDRMLVVFSAPTETNSVGVATMKECAASLKEHDSRRAILVVQKRLSSFAKQSLDTMDKMYKLEIFQEADLLVNVMDSVFVPKHQVLLPEEKKALCERYQISDLKQQLPMLRQTDPVARYLGLEKGQVVRIDRAIKSNAEPDRSVISYRIVA